MPTQLNQLQAGVWMILGILWSFLDRAARALRIIRSCVSSFSDTYIFRWITNTNVFMVFAIETMVGSWKRGFFRCSDCYFNSKQSASLTCWNVMWDMPLSQGDSPFGMIILIPETKENDFQLNRFAVRAFNTAHMDEEQIWTPQLFITDQPALKHWFSAWCRA